jgi:transmembrane sensor
MMSTGKHEQIEAAAGDWLAKRDSRDWTDSDQAQFADWLSESTLHRVAYLQIEQVWERSARLQALAAGRTSRDVPPPGVWAQSLHSTESTPQSFRRSTVVRTAAAAALVVAALGVGFALWPSPLSYRTAVGGMASVPMSDGSKVTLNTDSQIRVEVTSRERRVELQRGEAFFDVIEDARRPFVVHAGNKRVVVLGTKFSVRREGDDLKVVVAEGKVRVESAGSPQAAAAGTVARASDAGVLLQKKGAAEVEEALSWRNGNLVFRDVTLADAVAEFNRYNIRKIVIRDAAIGSFAVEGSFRADNIDEFARLLSLGYPLRVEQRDHELVIERRE